MDPIALEVFRNRLEGVAEEMGQVLIRGAYSPNIKERRDCSTALFDADGRLVAQAEHIPVHLGAMPAAVDAVLERDPRAGDVWVLNDPFAGGTHLPDVTMVSPVGATSDDGGRDGGSESGDRLGYAVSRAHHADVGGATPGSMPAGAAAIYEEGVRIPPVRLQRGGERVEDVIDLLLANVRNPDERRADLRAQLAANERGADRLRELAANDDHPLDEAFDAVVDYSRERTTSALGDLPDGTYEAEDVLEGDGRTDEDVPVVASVTVDGDSLSVDFTGTADQVTGNCNAPRAVAHSAVYFAVRAVTDPEIPPNQGCYDPITVRIPEGSLLDPKPPAAVVGGNVETSQRVTDVVFEALAEAVPERVPAQGQGTMNNLTVGARDGSFAYYETVGGGFGARSDRDGMDGVQVGMTNTLNTPVEALELAYPLRVERYGFRPDSGGDGEYRGGLGLERAVRVLEPATVSLLTERRRHAPQGRAGGAPGGTGENVVVRPDGDRAVLPAKVTRDVPAESTVVVRTPGGGGYGDPAARDPARRGRDRVDGVVTEDGTLDGTDADGDDDTSE
ncbi:hydantoinase B/oxoprolinase family protein [Halomarina oriensis]|uniref:Hydantoinase B/oxoprolinase family protein n=1 Tax=Halomarina oriensis TaxID=671145 RepID=A0A6B0GI04_9EURY|nr:hydantoinase B/oxoprolinase family protein [Halomarina oriensis]MWG34492.1 hydantoinase B/oxoprolinase family protein [Halomarina oriensis]